MPKTPRRTIRIPDQLWLNAQTRADSRGENLSDIIRQALQRYLAATEPADPRAMDLPYRSKS